MASNAYCEATDTIGVTFFRQLFPFSLDLGPDTVICMDSQLLLDGSLPGIEDYVWEDGSIGPSRLVTAAGKYQLTGKYAACSLEDEIVVDLRSCEGRLYIPTAFSPNYDGINDAFELYGLDFQVDEMKIFDRWGGLMFTSKAPVKAWDGLVDGKPASMGTYLYWVQVTDTLSGEKKLWSGELELVR
jgi:gliding motility-associated-like protein